MNSRGKKNAIDEQDMKQISRVNTNKEERQHHLEPQIRGLYLSPPERLQFSMQSFMLWSYFVYKIPFVYKASHGTSSSNFQPFKN